MMLIHASNSVTADCCGWTSQFDDTDLLIQSLDGNAAIRIRPYDYGSAPAQNYLRELLRNSPESKSSPLNEIAIADFGIGADSPILLYYKKNNAEPIVINLDWQEGDGKNNWVVLAENFAAFVELMGI